jgi:hypothetical protein
LDLNKRIYRLAGWPESFCDKWAQKHFLSNLIHNFFYFKSSELAWILLLFSKKNV